ncbi:putative lipoprotein [Bythopirellula polymerisocia]|uniref:Putative lipoprotein n=2 Tax=Bythopirellula polymerisocia TaxID=2528003 RepID=A0A5C6CBH5_9BACT|nr:putative lipoprotein [Bythopirellula polymerisocia]
MVTVNGDGSTWTSSGILYVGHEGEGTLNVEAGGQVTSHFEGIVGNLSDSVGTVTVSGTDEADNPSTWTNSSDLIVGKAGQGTLNVEDGGLVSNVFGFIGFDQDSMGTVTVTGEGSTWTTSNFISVGVVGHATLNIEAGGQVSNDTGSIGGDPGSTGIATVTGEGSTWTNTSNLYVGNSGEGTLNIEAGGQVSSTTGVIGNSSTGLGGVTVRGTDGSGTPSRWTVGGGLTVGNAGSGGLFVRDGAEVQSGETHVGVSGNGNVLINDANWTIATNLYVGDFGVGSVNVQNGGQLSSEFGFIADGASPISTVTVAQANESGTPATFTTSQDLVVGGNNTTAGGNGRLNVGLGGVVNVGNRLRLWDSGTVNLNGGTINLAELDSVFVNVFGTFNFSHGKLNFTTDQTIDTGGTLETALGGSLTIGFAQHLGVEGVATILKPVAIDGGTLSVGEVVNPQLIDLQRGTLNINNQPVAIEPGGPFGNTLNLQEETTINAALGVTNHGVVKGNGTLGGPFTNAADGEVQGLAGNNLQFTGSGNSNSGQLTLSGGQVHFTQDFTNNATGLVIGNGTLRGDGETSNDGNMAFSATANVIGDVVNNASGTIISAGGATTFYDDVVNNGEIRTYTNSFTVYFGSYSGSGDTGSGTVIMEGDLKPGSSPGIMSFGGDLEFGPAATLEIELGGLLAGDDFDHITVADDITLNGLLDVSIINGFTHSAGDTFEIITAASVLDTFDTVSLPPLPGDLHWFVNYGATSVELVTTFAGDFDFDGDVDGRDFLVWQQSPAVGSLTDWQSNYGATTGTLGATSAAVPEPSSLLLMALLLVTLSLRRKAA